MSSSSSHVITPGPKPFANELTRSTNSVPEPLPQPPQTDPPDPKPVPEPGKGSPPPILDREGRAPER